MYQVLLRQEFCFVSSPIALAVKVKNDYFFSTRLFQFTIRGKDEINKSEYAIFVCNLNSCEKTLHIQ